MSGDLSLKQIQKEYHGTLKSYAYGFFTSLFLTILSFSLVITRAIPEGYLIYGLIGLALIQAAVQLIFFLHVGREAKPRWESLVFYFMILVVLIVALGSLWIIYDLNNRVMNMPQEMTEGTMPHD